MWERIRPWFENETRYKALAALGAAVTTVVGGAFAVFTLFVDPKHEATQPISTINVKENMGITTYGAATFNGNLQLSPTQDQMKQIQAPQLDEIEALKASNNSLFRLLDRARTTSLFPNAAEALQVAVADLAAKAPHETRYKEALVLLRNRRIKDAEPLLLEVASDKAASAQDDDDKISTGEAYRDLAAIAGLIDSSVARSAYQSATYFLPSNGSLVSEYLAYSAVNPSIADAHSSPRDTSEGHLKSPQISLNDFGSRILRGKLSDMSFDKPLSADPAAGVQRCTYYPDLTVRETQTDSPDTGPTYLLPGAAGGKRAACVAGGRKLNTSGQAFVGRRGNFLFFVPTIANGTEPFQILSLKDGSKLYHDVMVPGAFKAVSASAASLHLVYTHGFDGSCSLLVGGTTCWATMIKEGKFAASISQQVPPFRACQASYNAPATKTAPSSPSMITYDVDVTIEAGKRAVVNSRGVLGCEPAG